MSNSFKFHTQYKFVNASWNVQASCLITRIHKKKIIDSSISNEYTDIFFISRAHCINLYWSKRYKTSLQFFHLIIPDQLFKASIWH